MPNRHIIRVVLFIAVVHFVLTSIIGYYAAYRVGGGAGESIGRLLIDGYESRGTMPESTIDQRYRDILNTTEATAAQWQLAFVLISLPVGFALEPLFKPISRGWFDQALANQLSLSQLRTRIYALGLFENLLNSISLGFLVYLGLRIAKRRNAP